MTMNETPTPDSVSLLRSIADARPEPSADLWTRIEAAHTTRVRRRRLYRLVAGGAFSVAVIASVALVGLHSPAGSLNRSTDIDWQARAQALELQLQALQQTGSTPVAMTVADTSDPAAIELEDIDYRLQAAYEHGVYSNELVPLWKRRSELLATLITARKEGLKLTRI